MSNIIQIPAESMYDLMKEGATDFLDQDYRNVLIKIDSSESVLNRLDPGVDINMDKLGYNDFAIVINLKKSSYIELLVNRSYTGLQYFYLQYRA